MVEIKLKYLMLESKSYIYWILLGVCSCLLNCNNRISKDSPQITFARQDKVDSITYLPDTTVNDILELENYLSVEKFIIDNKKFEFIERIREVPVVIFLNNNLKEYLLAYQYEGDTQCAFSCFEIGYNRNNVFNKFPHIKTNYSSFQTESKILLGIPFNELLRIKKGGVTNTNQSIIRYKIDISDPFVKRYNMPNYFMEIELKKGYVDKIKYGFGYP